MGTGADAAIQASDLTLVRGDLESAPVAIELSRATLAVIKGNLFWAFAYNIAALPLAALWLLNPLIAGIAMAFSSVFVVSNSLRLRSFRSVTPNSIAKPGRVSRRGRRLGLWPRLSNHFRPAVYVVAGAGVDAFPAPPTVIVRSIPSDLWPSTGQMIS
jgi:hypothetical protein